MTFLKNLYVAMMRSQMRANMAKVKLFNNIVT